MQTEATEVFFATTKLFQSKDIALRRMVYLMIKEITPSADEVSFSTWGYFWGAAFRRDNNSSKVLIS